MYPKKIPPGECGRLAIRLLTAHSGATDWRPWGACDRDGSQRGEAAHLGQEEGMPSDFLSVKRVLAELLFNMIAKIFKCGSLNLPNLYVPFFVMRMQPVKELRQPCLHYSLILKFSTFFYI